MKYFLSIYTEFSGQHLKGPDTNSLCGEGGFPHTHNECPTFQLNSDTLPGDAIRVHSSRA